jgi:hypothetical protein
LLGTTAPVSPVPTGSTDETRSWETMIAANSIRQLNERMNENGIVTLDDFKKYVSEKLPAELVSRSVTGSYLILQEGAAQNPDAPADGKVDVQLQAKIAAAARVQDEFLNQVLTGHRRSRSKTYSEEIAAAVPLIR